MTDGTRPRTRTLLLLAATFAAAGAMLLYPPAGTGDDPSTASPSRHASAAPKAPAGDIASRPLSASQPRGEPEATPRPAAPARTPLATEPEPWLPAATAYAAAFTAHVEDHAEWVAGLEPWVTPDLAEQYELTDPARRPHGAVDRIEPITPGDYSAHVQVTYDTGLVLKVRVANGPDGWQVTYVEPSRDSDDLPSGASVRISTGMPPAIREASDVTAGRGTSPINR